MFEHGALTSQSGEEAVHVYVVVQFFPWFNFYFLLFLGMVIYDNELKTKENKN